MAQSTQLAILVLATAAVLFAATAWSIGRRWGVAGLASSWLVGSLVLTGLLAARVGQQPAVLGVAPELREPLAMATRFLPLWMVVLGAVTVVVWRRLRAPVSRFSVGFAALSVGACFGGLLLFLLLDAAFEIAPAFGRP